MRPGIKDTIKKAGIGLLISYLTVVAIAMVVRPGYESVKPAALPPDFPFAAFWQDGDTRHCQVFRWKDYENLVRMELEVSLQAEPALLSVCEQDIRYLDEHGTWRVTFDWQDAGSSWTHATLDSTSSDPGQGFVVSYQPDGSQVNQSRYTVMENKIIEAEYKSYEVASVARAVLPVAMALFAVFAIGFGLTTILRKLESLE
jgi:hypothetical protein